MSKNMYLFFYKNTLTQDNWSTSKIHQCH